MHGVMGEKKYDTPGPQWVLLEDVLRESRGPELCGVKRNHLGFYGMHLGTVGVLLLTRSFLLQVVQGAIGLQSLYAVLYTGFLFCCLALHSLNYQQLYGSDPGWVRRGVKVDLPQEVCRFCSVQPSLRSRHDFKTGQCVHKFDHYCWFLGCTVGDLNHLRFWSLMLAQSFLILWAILLAGSSISHCQLAGTTSALASCWEIQPISTAALLVLLCLLLPCLSLTAGLFVFHTYLAMTNQTTYEVLKGSKIHYLEPFYAHYDGPKQQALVGKGLHQFLSREAWGVGVPRPFSSKSGPLNGVGENLNTFFFGQKPYPYKYQQPLPQNA